ncbi:hypothetical protein SB778_03790 [Paraburkholderia sp. SIMBA_050]
MSSVVKVFQVDLVPVISTCHVSESTAKQLDLGDTANTWTIVAAYEHGWFLYVQPEDLHDSLDMPADLRDVMHWGRRHNLQWIRLDCDADPVSDLEQYDW